MLHFTSRISSGIMQSFPDSAALVYSPLASLKGGPAGDSFALRRPSALALIGRLFVAARVRRGTRRQMHEEVDIKPDLEHGHDGEKRRGARIVT